MKKEQERPDPMEILAGMPALLAEHHEFPDEWKEGEKDFCISIHMALFWHDSPELTIKLNKEQFEYMKRVKAATDEQKKQALANRNDDYADLMATLKLFKNDPEVLDVVLIVLWPRLKEAGTKAKIPPYPTRWHLRNEILNRKPGKLERCWMGEEV